MPDEQQFKPDTKKNLVQHMLTQSKSKQHFRQFTIQLARVYPQWNLKLSDFQQQLSCFQQNEALPFMHFISAYRDCIEQFQPKEAVTLTMTDLPLIEAYQDKLKLLGQHITHSFIEVANFLKSRGSQCSFKNAVVMSEIVSKADLSNEQIGFALFKIVRIIKAKSFYRLTVNQLKILTIGFDHKQIDLGSKVTICEALEQIKKYKVIARSVDLCLIVDKLWLIAQQEKGSYQRQIKQLKNKENQMQCQLLLLRGKLEERVKLQKKMAQVFDLKLMELELNISERQKAWQLQKNQYQAKMQQQLQRINELQNKLEVLNKKQPLQQTYNCLCQMILPNQKQIKNKSDKQQPQPMIINKFKRSSYKISFASSCEQQIGELREMNGSFLNSLQDKMLMGKCYSRKQSLQQKLKVMAELQSVNQFKTTQWRTRIISEVVVQPSAKIMQNSKNSQLFAKWLNSKRLVDFDFYGVRNFKTKKQIFQAKSGTELPKQFFSSHCLMEKSKSFQLLVANDDYLAVFAGTKLVRDQYLSGLRSVSYDTECPAKLKLNFCAGQLGLFVPKSAELINFLSRAIFRRKKLNLTCRNVESNQFALFQPLFMGNGSTYESKVVLHQGKQRTNCLALLKSDCILFHSQGKLIKVQFLMPFLQTKVETEKQKITVVLIEHSVQKVYQQVAASFSVKSVAEALGWKASLDAAIKLIFIKYKQTVEQFKKISTQPIYTVNRN